MIGRCASDKNSIAGINDFGHGRELQITCKFVARTCYGGIINMFCLGSIISIVYECRTTGITQAKIVTEFFRSFDVNNEEIGDEDASKIASGRRNPPAYVMEPLKTLKPDSYASMATYFTNNIIGLIKENERDIVRDTIIMMIQEDPDIRDNTIVEVISGISKYDLEARADDLGSLIAGVFLYVLRNTQNTGRNAKEKAKDYLNKVRNGIGTVKKSTAVMQSVSAIGVNVEKSEYPSRELELMEERILQEATAFCIKHDKKRDFIPLCHIVSVTNPTKQHGREMFNEYCTCTASTKKKILEMNDVKESKITNKDWWWKYLKDFEQDYRKYVLGADRLLYSFGQYFHRLLGYKDYPVDINRYRVFPIKVQTPFLQGLPNYKHDIHGVIDEYIFYKDTPDYKKILEPPMDYLWRNLNLGGCKECELCIVLALFIIGTCRCIPNTGQEQIEPYAYSGPGVSDVETAEDLFYLTLLYLYETYTGDKLDIHELKELEND